MGPYAGVVYTLTLCPLQSRLQHIHRGQPYARVDFIPQSRTLDLASEHLLKTEGTKKRGLESPLKGVWRFVIYSMNKIGGRSKMF
jgi:hypothetical protein